MKVTTRPWMMMFGMLMVLASFVEGGVLDRLRNWDNEGEGEAAEVESEEEEQEDGVLGRLFNRFGSDEDEEMEKTTLEEPEGAGLFVSEQEFQVGKRGYYCLKEMAGLEKDNVQNWESLFMRPIARVILSAFGSDGVERLCGPSLQARMQNSIARTHSISQRRKLREMEQKKNQRHLRRQTYNNNVTKATRRTQSCEAWQEEYPGMRDTTGAYNEFASSRLGDYFSDDTTDKSTHRTDPLKEQEILADLNMFRFASNILNRCSLIWSGINQLISFVDVPGINQESASAAVQTLVCDLPNTYNTVVQYRLQRDQELVNFHNSLVTDAEIGAMYHNTKTLANVLCEHDNTVAHIVSDIDQLKVETSPQN